ncbi:glycosyltransferase family 2 protein [Prosthecobacter dejongeii]|uniref:Cellulose synthase/poly-beta-1,6-N-acetylglucosamine synthase-like glycosyltransferase n=1 Tax=Prosthecobacter dejongeii TaxID=48465 RepID=A0A7W7YI19_9BACT|nr:glycosyltransferase family 2 protein [Prosthecobacter dejongeii]MBB5036595.1 cellulose synthase/poly-beta-1,6-N-acetylglucosamine synthase-like glycosyltransferase [Prosthecobacter dejongeii]
MWLLLLLTCLLLIAYAHAGYPLWMALLARLRPKQVKTDGTLPAGMSVVMSVYNAESRIQERLRNLLGCEWPGELEIVVFCDGCTDATAEKVAELADTRVRVMSHPQQRGKATALNEALPTCRYPVVVLCDARQDFHPQALMELTQPFADAEVGAVSGLLEIAASASGSGQGVDLYWKIERKLREWEGRYDSVIGCTGAIYAIRRQLFQPLHPATILDDVVVPMRIAVAGHRVLYAPTAIAYDPQTLDPALEKKRKLRTLAGNYQMMEHFPGWILPWRNRTWWQLISHKYLRLAVPWLMLAVLLLSVLAPPSPWVVLLLAGQVFAYGAATLGLLFPQMKLRLFSIPAGFLLLQVTCLRALGAYFKARRDALSLWQAAPVKAS